MLNLPEFEIIKREENEYYYKFTVVAKDRPFVCTQCLWDESPILGDNKRFTALRNEMYHELECKDLSELNTEEQAEYLMKIIMKFLEKECI